MSVRLIANVLDYVHGLPHGTKLLLLCLADYADDKGTCWPSFQSLANRSDMSRRHVIRVMGELEELGLIKRVEVRPYKPTVYRLAIPTSDTHVTSVANVTSDTHDTRVVTPTSLGSDTHVTTTSDAHVTQSVNKPSREPPIEPSDARAKADPLQGFAEFWAQYPRKTGKQDAERAWVKVKPSPELQAEIIAAVARQKTWEQWQEGFIPHPATFLNRARWEDEEPPRRKATGKGSLFAGIEEFEQRMNGTYEPEPEAEYVEASWRVK